MLQTVGVGNELYTHDNTAVMVFRTDKRTQNLLSDVAVGDSILHHQTEPVRVRVDSMI